MDVLVTTGAISHAKLQSNFHHQQTNTQLFTGQMPFLSPNQQYQSTEGKTANHKIRVGNFYPHAVLTMVKTPVKTGLGKTPKTHELGKIGEN